ncbi:Ubiquitin-conjugating enzyme E2 [Spironucleus salmonicida]|nr:Ubiquitin-conjugating enzyme E2 [Spironucleus salmonicida]
MKRIKTELKQIKDDPPANCQAQPINNDLNNWTATIIGPKDTLYEGGLFNLKINFPPDYPFRPPHCSFETKIFHPNISLKGDICLDILKQNWSPVLTISKVLLSICSLLDDPNPSDPLNGDAAKLFKEDKLGFDLKVKSMVQQFAQK